VPLKRAREIDPVRQMSLRHYQSTLSLEPVVTRQLLLRLQHQLQAVACAEKLRFAWSGNVLSASSKLAANYKVGLNSGIF
jgi:hypothetical protein